ncbi:stalk domain-containing protein [Cohnella lupini]|uniref:stalk domain-containing protein n=1 Tax=Cohnella lupini TaxID=1294267 RepID=UPI0015F27FD4|nr:stalk domain-containing protein [Cohnella lupini]
MGAASAATVTKASAVQVTNSTYTVNGIAVNLATFFEKGRTLVSLRDLSTKLGVKLQATKGVITATLKGHTVELTANSTLIKVDGAEQKLTVPVKSVKGVTYVELKTFVQALGGQFAKDASGTIWIDADLLGNVDRIQWVDSAKFIATQETETGRLDYLVDAQTASYEQLRILEEISDFVIAPNGAKAAYTNNAGEVFVIDFATKLSTKVSEDTSIKPELVWSSDSSIIYFLQGDKGSVVAKLDPATGTISKVLEDKVDYKANLDVSADGKTVTYTVTKPGAVVADANLPVESDDVAIDMKGTEPQIFAYTVDPSIKDNKPAQLSTTADDKVFIHAAADGSSVGYVSVSSEDEVKSTLVIVSNDKTSKTLFTEKDVYQAVVSGGKWYLLTEGNGSNQFVYEVDPATGAAKQLYTLSDTVSEIIVKSGSPFAVVNEGRVFLDINGQWKPTTK